MNKSKLRKTYDMLAEDWSNDSNRGGWGEKELKEFVKLVGRGKVLDLGCGAGVQAKILVEEGLDVVGLDLSPKMISFAKNNVSQAEFIVGDIENLKFKEEEFDGIYARASLLHISKKNIAMVLHSLNIILKSNGVLYLALKEGNGEQEQVDIKYGKEVKRFFSFFTSDEISNLLSESGFKILKINVWQDRIVWLHIFAKKD